MMSGVDMRRHWSALLAEVCLQDDHTPAHSIVFWHANEAMNRDARYARVFWIRELERFYFKEILVGYP